MKKKLFFLFLSIINLTVINVVSCQNQATHLNENIDALIELENELKNYNWKTPSYNEQNNNLERMINDLETIKLKISIAEKLKYNNDKVKFHDQFNKLEKNIETMKNNTIPALKEINLKNIKEIFDWINSKTVTYINIIKSKIMSIKNNKFLFEKAKRGEIINKFFTNFPINSILLPINQSQKLTANKNCNNIIDCDILNFTNTVLHHFYIMEQMKASNEIKEEIETKKIEILHKLWIKLWETNLDIIYENLKNPNDDFIK